MNTGPKHCNTPACNTPPSKQQSPCSNMRALIILASSPACFFEANVAIFLCSQLLPRMAISKSRLLILPRRRRQFVSNFRLLTRVLKASPPHHPMKKNPPRMTISKSRLHFLPRRKRQFLSNLFRHLLRALKASPHHPRTSPSPSTSHRESNVSAHL